MNIPHNGQPSMQAGSLPLAAIQRSPFGKLGAQIVPLTVLRSARYLVGIAPPSQSGHETPWSECTLDLVMWAGVFATCAVLLYLVSHGLKLLGLL